MFEEIYNILPSRLRREISINLEEDAYKASIVNSFIEIRIRVNCPVIFKTPAKEYLIFNSRFLVNDLRINRQPDDCLTANQEDINEMLELISGYSIYAFESDIRQGFITIKGGHRVGIAGKVVLEVDKIKSIKNISFLNLRIAHQVRGCAKNIIPYVLVDNKILHTLIISPPGCGKTTMLRDLVRMISNGNKICGGKNVGVVDERSEIAACYMGIPQNDVGIRTDILDSCPKAEGMLMLLRTMNPDVIAVDEIGSSIDIDAITYVINCGCSIIATIHGENVDEIRTRPILRRLINERIFERYIVLGKSMGVGTINSIFDERGNELLKQPFSTEEFLEVY